MVIDGGLRTKLQPGMRLRAKYKGDEYVAELVAGEDGKLSFKLADGRQFKSPSAAGSAVMNGQACNGWRFWSVDRGEKQPTEAVRTRPRKTSKARPGPEGPEPEPVTTEPFVEE